MLWNTRNYVESCKKALTSRKKKNIAKPTNDLKSTPFTEVIELERIVTPDEEKRVYHIFVRRKKICTRHPEGFETEEIARFDIAWPEEPKEELKELTEEKEEIKISTD